MNYSTKNLATGAPNYQDGLRVRDRRKATRGYIDNEFFDRGYGKFLRKYFIVYVCLAKFANAETQTCFPSYKRIMKETGIRNRNTIAKAITVLEFFGFIAVRPKGRKGSNLYYLLHHSKWWPQDSITIDTVRKVSKGGRRQYQKLRGGSINSDTGNPLSNSIDKIQSQDVDKLRKMRQTLIADKRLSDGY